VKRLRCATCHSDGWWQGRRIPAIKDAFAQMTLVDASFPEDVFAFREAMLRVRAHADTSWLHLDTLDVNVMRHILSHLRAL
jgi:hypothetical protein